MIRKPIINPVIRTIKGRGNNKIEVYKDYAVLVVIYNKVQEIRVTIDCEDINRVIKHLWHYNKEYGYCACKEPGVPAFYNFIMDVYDSHYYKVVQKDGNKFNCRKENLMVLTNSEHNEFKKDKKAFLAKREQPKVCKPKVIKSSVSAPVIETEPVKIERSYSHIREISNGYLINIELEQESYVEFFPTKEEAIQAYDVKVMEIYRRLDPFNLYN